MAFPQQIIPATSITPGLNVAANDVPGPTAYVTGGVFVSASVLGLNQVKFVQGMDLSSDGLNFVRIISISGQGAPRFKVLWFVNATGAEVANATNLSAKSVRVLGYGV